MKLPSAVLQRFWEIMDNTVLHYKNIVYFLKRRCLRNINDNYNFVGMYVLSLHKIMNFINAKLYVIVKICFFSINNEILIIIKPICLISMSYRKVCNLNQSMHAIYKMWEKAEHYIYSSFLPKYQEVRSWHRSNWRKLNRDEDLEENRFKHCF